LIVACSALAGCQFLLDVDEKQCEQHDDCLQLIGRGWECGEENVCVQSEVETPTSGSSGGGSGTSAVTPDAGPPPPELPDNWKCLREPKRQIVPNTSVLDIRFVIVDFVTLDVPEDITARACDNRDPECAAPLAMAERPESDGYMTLENLPHGFNGFIMVSAPRIVTSILYSNRPYHEELEQFEGPSVVSPETQMAIASGGGEMVDPNLGTAILDVYDCNGDAAAGVVYTKEDALDEHPFYFVGGYPDRQQEATSLTDQLNASGTPRAVGGFSKVPPGFVILVARLSPDAYNGADDLIGKVTVKISGQTMAFGRIYAGY
jgi:hypothetical protein